jgi:large subunit ribosomal protein L20
MSRVKRGTTAHKKRKNVLKNVKGFKWGRKNKFKAAKEALLKAWTYAYRDRKTKKRTMRRSWNVAINAGCRKNNTTYKDFIYNLKKKDIQLNRKILSTLSREHPQIFKEIIEKVSK